MISIIIYLVIDSDMYISFCYLRFMCKVVEIWVERIYMDIDRIERCLYFWMWYGCYIYGFIVNVVIYRFV